MTTHPVLDQALTLEACGISVIPIKPGGTKMPPIPWKPYQVEAAEETEIRAWFEQHPDWGLAAITGQVSGGLVMIELESDAMQYLPVLADRATEHGIADLWGTLLTGWSEKTPTGGIHFHVRVDAPKTPKNTKLARRHDRHPLAETRGEGGLTVVAPTPGTCHPTGQPWTTYYGGPTTIPTLTRAEYDQLCSVFRSIDETPKPTPPAAARTPRPATTGGVTPGDDFEAKTTWDDILTPAGWTKLRRDGNGYAWVRPNKNPNDGISATTGRDQDRDRLYVFTTATEFEPETPYTKFGAYALLNHGGDHAAAAKQLRAEGYGTPPAERDIVIDLPIKNQATQPAHTLPERQHVQAAPDAQIIPIGTAKATLRDLTEDANALLLVEVYGQEIRFVQERNQWLGWNGHTWQPQTRSGGHVREKAKNLMRALPTDQKHLAAWRKRSLTNSGITNMLALAATDPDTTISQNDLDQHADEINTPAGIVNLRTGKLRNPEPARLHTKTTLCGPDPGMPTPTWDRFLADTFTGHDEVQHYIQPLLGYCLTGRTGAQILPFFHGPGANGKSVLAETVMRLMADYASTAPPDFLIRTGQAQHPTEIARLQGIRFVIASEVPEGSRFDETKIKQLTGGDTLTARYMHGDFFTFKPTHKIIVLGNDKPTIRGGGYSLWRRLRLIPFTNQVPEEDRDPELADKLLEREGPGILAWLIAGAQTYYATGLHTPDEVLAATEAYELEEDHIGRFVEDRLIIAGGDAARVSYADMREAYTDWCQTEGIRPLTANTFTRKVTERFGIDRTRSKSERSYTNVLLANTGEVSGPDDAWNDLGGGYR